MPPAASRAPVETPRPGAALRRRTFGWMMFDWASQPYYTLLLTFVFGPYFAATAAEAFLAQGLGEEAARARAQTLWSGGQAVSGAVIALLAPIVGALADAAGRRTGWIVALSALYVLASAGLFVLEPGGAGLWTALVLFGLGLLAAEFLTLLTNAILPDLAGPDPAGASARVGRVSGAGFGLGYAGGVLSLAIMLGLFAETEAGVTLLGRPPALGLDGAAREGTRFVGPFTALWYVVFMIPFFAYVREPPAPPAPPAPSGPRPRVSRALGDLWRTIRGLLSRPSLAAYLASSMLYRDALGALYAFGGTYAVLVLGWPVTQVGAFGIIGAVAAALASWWGGRLDGRYGPRPVIAGAVLLLALVSLAIALTARGQVLGVPVAEGSAAPDLAFYVIGALIGGAGGVLQSASRTMMVRHAAPGRAAEAFGLYALSGKATAFLAPALVALATWASGSPRLGVLPVIALFLAGLWLLAYVRPEGDAR